MSASELGLKNCVLADWQVPDPSVSFTKLRCPWLSGTKGQLPYANKFTHTYRRLTQELTREPLMEELAQELDMDIRKVRQIMRISQDILSLDSPVGSEEDTSL